MINKVQVDKINESELLINKIIKLINKVNNIINQAKWEKSKEDKDNIDNDDILEIQKILFESINDNKNGLKIKFDNINQFIKNIYFIIKNKDIKVIDSKNNIKNEICNNINSIGKNIKLEKFEIKEEGGYIPKMEEGYKMLEEPQNNLQDKNKN